MDRKRLDLARALATGPSFLLLDEFMAGLNPAETAAAMALVRRLVAEGLTVLMVEHIVWALMDLARRIIVLSAGRERDRRRPARRRRRRSPGRRRLSGGRAAARFACLRTRMLEIEGLEAAYGDVRVLGGVTLSVRPGEIVALLGPNGAGKSTLLACVAGLVRPRAGRIRCGTGKDLRAVPPRLIVERGLAIVPEGRRLFASMTVEDEDTSLGAFSPRARAARRESYERVYALFPVLRERRRQIVRALSGGQQQMVAVGRALMARPRPASWTSPRSGSLPWWRDPGRAGRDQPGGRRDLPGRAERAPALTLAHRAYILEGGRVAGEGGGATAARPARAARLPRAARGGRVMDAIALTVLAQQVLLGLLLAGSTASPPRACRSSSACSRCWTWPTAS